MNTFANTFNFIHQFQTVENTIFWFSKIYLIAVQIVKLFSTLNMACFVTNGNYTFQQTGNGGQIPTDCTFKACYNNNISNANVNTLIRRYTQVVQCTTRLLKQSKISNQPWVVFTLHLEISRTIQGFSICPHRARVKLIPQRAECLFDPLLYLIDEIK